MPLPPPPGCLSFSSPRLLPFPSVAGLRLSLPPHLSDGATIFSAAVASTPTPLWAILLGRPFEVTVEGAQLAVSLDPHTLEPHAYALLAWAGLIRMPGDEGGQAGVEEGPATPAAGLRDPPPESEPPTPGPGEGGDGAFTRAEVEAEGAAVVAAAAAAAKSAAGGGGPPPASSQPATPTAGVALPKGLSLAPARAVLNARFVAWTATVSGDKRKIGRRVGEGAAGASHSPHQKNLLSLTAPPSLSSLPLPFLSRSPSRTPP